MALRKASWKIYKKSSELWDGLYKACSEAHETIDFEQFIFSTDEIGQKFINLFYRKNEEGVKIRLLIDTAGSYTFYTSDEVDKMRKVGINIRFFNEISPWRITKSKIWLNRDHRKLAVIDRDKALIGGVGIGDWMHDWRDTHVEISGPTVAELQGAFEHMWWVAGKDSFIRSREPRQTEDGFTVLTNSPHFRNRFIDRTLVDMIRSAEKRVYITTPYFVPDIKFFRALRLVAKRGVDVRLIVPFSSDHPHVDFASHFYFRKALKYGVKIFTYMPTMIHSKVVIVDDWVSIGSANIDNLSSEFNYEINLASVNSDFVQELVWHFESDITQSVQISKEEWARRALWQKILEFVCAPFGRFF